MINPSHSHEPTPCPVRHWAITAPDHIAIHTTSPLSYRQLDARLNSVSQQLERYGVRRGNHLAAVVRGALEDVLLAWACVRSGVVFCPLNPAFPVTKQRELAVQLDADAFWSAGEIPPGNWLPLPLDFTRELPASEEAWLLTPTQLSNMILTSGSSGTPKAVVHRLSHHLASARGSASLIPLDEACGWLLSLPLFHIGGYAILFRVFLAGATLVLDQRERPLKERLECQPITHASLVPTQLWRLLAAGFDPARTRLRELLLGGAAIPQPLVHRLCAMGLVPKVSYGLSEMGSQVCTAVPGEAGVVGKPLPGREVCIKEQEICVRGATLFAGYYRAGGLELPLDGEGWFHTRDKGRFTAAGELLVEGRLDNLFISGGENIQPETIEQRLLDHPAVARALVVPIPSEEWGERPAAFIDWHNEPISCSELAAWVRAALPSFMVPDHWQPWPTLDDSFKPQRKHYQQLMVNPAHTIFCRTLSGPHSAVE
ncbi:AMP-binding protein [Aeromonas cavernicola]|uniref:2-succinylbenzoate-CoA ligase n=1 Tax=Aeromonas cavernicola TaxID=1006623 RepID=A0A2H9U6N7_9GAMM|nr:AMP-binding protein [Aeromonas cavernicola]PJG59644.1 2-succinylbenzoate-CoA ligase [Aeromonas cavernicola]